MGKKEKFSLSVTWERFQALKYDLLDLLISRRDHVFHFICITLYTFVFCICVFGIKLKSKMLLYVI